MSCSARRQDLTATPSIAPLHRALLGLGLTSLLAGCATSPSLLGANPPALQLRPPIAIVAASKSTSITTTASVRGKAEGAKAGMASGASACVINPIDPGLLLVAVACLPFGMAIGSVRGEAAAATLGSLENAELTVKQALSGVGANAVLLEEARGYAAKHGIRLAGEGAASVGTLELGIAELNAETPGTANLPYRFRLTVQGQLREGASGKVLDAFTYRASTQQLTLEQWTADDGRLVAEELRMAARRGAEAFIDEWVLIYRGKPGESAKVDIGKPRRPIAEYVLEPTQPTADESAHVRAQQFSAFTPAIDPQPATFRWEQLPRSFAETGVSAERLAELRYEMRIFSAVAGTRRGDRGLYYADKLLATYSDIRSPEFTLSTPLDPCRNYYWTVRATFLLDGQPRATEWSGTYLPLGDPTWIRRGEGGPSWLPGSSLPDYYLPFRTNGSCR